MNEKSPIEQELDLERSVIRAKAGDRDALESVVRETQQLVYRVSLRFLWHPEDAEDATQEILIRIIRGLGGFLGKSDFRTWVYRVACNTLLTMRKKRMEQKSISFEEFGEDILRGIADDSLSVDYDVEQELLLEEIKIGCTHAMLICLDRNHRIAYILGEIIELDHNEAAEILEVTPATFRKRLSRARLSITSFMTSRCGLVNPVNLCRCRRRVTAAIELGRIDPTNLQFACSLEEARQFPQILSKIRQLEEIRRSAALYRSHHVTSPSGRFTSWLRKVIDDKANMSAD